MRRQLIFCVEADNKSKSDWFYIKATVEHFYKIDCDIRLSTIYLGGKGKFRDKGVLNQIQTLTKKYNAGSKNKSETIVIYAIDTDDYDSSQKDKDFFNSVERFCRENGYELIWFCKDIEQVYLHRRLEKSQKKPEAERFFRTKGINNKSLKLDKDNYKEENSNILKVLDRYLVKIRKGVS